MKAASLAEIKKELKHLSSEELENICLRLGRFKQENKELLTYLLFLSSSEDDYVQAVCKHIDERFEVINTDSYHYIKKSIRKTLREVKKFSRYSSEKTTEVELLLYFCKKLAAFSPSIKRNRVLMNIFERETFRVRQLSKKLHEDLQHDYLAELESIKEQLSSQ